MIQALDLALNLSLQDVDTNHDGVINREEFHASTAKRDLPPKKATLTHSQ